MMNQLFTIVCLYKVDNTAHLIFDVDGRQPYLSQDKVSAVMRSQELQAQNDPSQIYYKYTVKELV